MIRDVLFGIAIGDALGVPVEFRPRTYLVANPVTGMTGYGTHHQPPGTFSDDSSMAFCQTEALIGGYELKKLAGLFVNWHTKGYWTPFGKVFDEGIATGAAIERLIAGVDPLKAGGTAEESNGNGSLMRILPLMFYIKDMPISERYRHVSESSSVTHAHIRCISCCFYYTEYARLLASGFDKFSAYMEVNVSARAFLESIKVAPGEISRIDKLWKGDIGGLDSSAISGDGYVLHSLEASIWCLLTTGTYEEAVLKAVNLGQDTDTTGSITGGLAGLLYGFESIPKQWVELIARKADIVDLSKRLGKSLKAR